MTILKKDGHEILVFDDGRIITFDKNGNVVSITRNDPITLKAFVESLINQGWTEL